MTRPESAVLVGYGEIGTKSSTVRQRLADRLVASIRAVLVERSIPGAVERTWSRVIVRTGEPRAAAAAAAEAPGVVWARPARTCAPDLDAVAATVREAAADAGGESIAVRANHDGSADHGFGARDIEREGGAAAVAATDLAVDLDDPDATVRVDCRAEEAFVSTSSWDGPGGLPVGTQGTTVALVSGGIDSPVAAWEMLRRGCSVVPVYVSLGEYGGPDHRARAVETLRPLVERAPEEDLRLRVVPAGDVVAELVDAVGPTRMLTLRRAMLRIGAAVADREGADSLTTGEALGQKSSQTAANLAVTAAAVGCSVHRPLLTRDKDDIVAAARDLGTFRDSTLPVGCERVAPPHPETRASLDAVEAAEPDGILDRAAAAASDLECVDP